MGFCEGLIGAILYLFNVLLCLAGLGIFIIAIVATVEFRDYADADLFDDKYLWGPVALAYVVGILLILMGTMGLCGLKSRKKKVLYTHIALTITFLGMQIALVTVSFTSKDKIQESAEKSIRRQLTPAYRDGKDNVKKAIDKLQDTFDCCGGFNKTDYHSQALVTPPSCCSGKPANCGAPGTIVYDKGCGKALFDKFESHTTAQIAVAITFVVLQVIGVLFSCYLLHDSEGQYV